MTSQRRYPPEICFNPDCSEQFIPHDRRQMFCSDQCRINYNNDKRRQQNEERFFRESELRRIDQTLETLLDSKFFKDNEIKEEILDGFGIDRTIGTLEMNLLSKNPIRWYHAFGIEFLRNKLYTIHQRTNI
jgi:predicted nucleic acid-binding Zn ribbon protein